MPPSKSLPSQPASMKRAEGEWRAKEAIALEGGACAMCEARPAPTQPLREPSHRATARVGLNEASALSLHLAATVQPSWPSGSQNGPQIGTRWAFQAWEKHG